MKQNFWLIFLLFLFTSYEKDLQSAVVMEDDPYCEVNNGLYDTIQLYNKWEEENCMITRSGNRIYPDWYGGCYEDNGSLVMMYKNSYSCDKINIPEGAIKQSCMYSYNELDSLKRVVLERMREVNYPNIENVFGCGAFNSLNRVGIMLFNSIEEMILDFKDNVMDDERIKILGTDYFDSQDNGQDESLEYMNSKDILIKNIEEMMSYQESNSVRFLKSGAGIQKVGSEGGASLGYRVVDKNGNGGLYCRTFLQGMRYRT